MIEKRREPIINLGHDGVEKELDELLDNHIAEADDPDSNEEDLTCRTWSIGDLEIIIHMAETYPAALKVFKEVIEEMT